MLNTASSRDITFLELWTRGFHGWNIFSMPIDLTGQNLFMKDLRQVYEGNPFFDLLYWKLPWHEIGFPWSYTYEVLTDKFFLKD